MDVASTSSTSTSKVGKLIPKKLAAKRWKKQPSKESFGSTASSEEYPRGRSPNSREPPNNGSGSVSLSTTTSTTQSIEMADEDEGRKDLDPEESPEAYYSDHEDS